MKAISFYLYVVGVALLLQTGCSKHENAKYAETQIASPTSIEQDTKDEAVMPDSVAAPAYLGSSATVVKDKAKDNFIRTASMRFKVNNVHKATTFIEDITSQMGGYVTYTNLTADRGYVQHLNLGKDSLVILTPYTVANTLELKVPNEKLDSVLRQIVTLSQFLEYRTITATDMTLNLWAAQQQQQRLKKYTQRVSNAIDNRGKKLGETTTAEDNLLTREQEMDDVQGNAMRIRAEIAFSTIKLSIYQDEQIMTEKQLLPVSAAHYEPSFFAKLGDKLYLSITLLQEFVLLLAGIWWILGLLVGVVVVFRYVKNTKV